MKEMSKAVLGFTTAAVVGVLSGCSYFYHSAVPPEKVPDGKTASEYYDLGVRYKGAGWTEQSRESLNRAIKLGNGQDIAVKAKRYLETKLPRDPAPEDAVHMNIKGFNARIFNKDEAEKVWLECIKKYPRFEWAYSNLGSLYVEEEKYSQGEEYLNKALEINPSYVNAWLHLAECKRKQKDFDGAHSCLKKALDLDPDDPLAKLESMAEDVKSKQ
jgi:tetratricopeptide (TPR) repeat protein